MNERTAIEVERLRVVRGGRVLEVAPYCLSLRYAYDALDRVTQRGTLSGAGALDVGVVVAAMAAALALGAATLRRRTP